MEPDVTETLLKRTLSALNYTAKQIFKVLFFRFNLVFKTTYPTFCHVRLLDMDRFAKLDELLEP